MEKATPSHFLYKETIENILEDYDYTEREMI